VPQEFKIPEIGEGIESGTVVAVLVNEGDRVEVDQPVIEFETDKAVVEVPSDVAGVVTRLHVRANEEANVGQTIMTVDDSAEAGASESGDTEVEPKETEAEAPKSDTEPTAEAAPSEGEREAQPAPTEAAAGVSRVGTKPASQPAEGERSLIPAAPSVRRLARERGVDLREVPGSGILGRVSAQDVVRFAEGGAEARPAEVRPAQPALPDFSKWGEVERVPMSGIRKATVRSMGAAWASVPMVTHFDEADATEFEALRQRYKETAQAAGIKLTPTAMLVKVAASALRRFPDFNASLDVDANEIVYKRYVHIGVAVDTEHGLLVPVIKDADRKNVLEIAEELDTLAGKARERKLAPDDMNGGNFSVSNLGGIGGTGFTPIVAPPHVAILGVSRGAMKPVWNASTESFEPRFTMPFSLTYDHRLIDGAAAARFLRWFCRAVEDPFLMALEG
jgi:pyruvate dehydrogenase E2 component (dihydrolipoamide acetyltransferase)